MASSDTDVAIKIRPPLERVEWVDCAKGIGMVLIVAGHVLRGLVSADIVPHDKTAELMDSVLYSFHVPLFFLLSGLFFLKPQGAIVFIRKKAMVIIYPFIIWVIIQGVIEYCASSATNAHADVLTIIQGLVVPRSQFWFLPVLLWMNILTVSISRLSNWKPVLLGVAIIAAYISSSSKLGPNLIFFCIGATMGISGISKFSKIPFLILLPIGFILATILKYSASPLDYASTSLLLGVVGSLAIVSISMHLPAALSRLFEYIGKRSLVIFLAHIIFASGSRIVLKTAFGITNPIMHVITGTLIGVIAPLILERISAARKWDWLFAYKVPNYNKGMSFAKLAKTA